MASRTKGNVMDLVFTALFAALTAICAVISVPMPMTAVPVSLLVLGVLLTGGLLEKKKAFLAQLVYLLLGAIGLPIYAGFQAGVGVLFGPTGGYLLASPLMAFLTAWIVELAGRKNAVTLSLAMLAAMLVCYTFGTAWFCIQGGVPVGRGLALCVLPFLIPDAVKLVAAVTVTTAVETVFKRLRAA